MVLRRSSNKPKHVQRFWDDTIMSLQYSSSPKATKLITADLDGMISVFEMITFRQKIPGKIFADDIGIRLNWDRKFCRVDKS